MSKEERGGSPLQISRHRHRDMARRLSARIMWGGRCCIDLRLASSWWSNKHNHNSAWMEEPTGHRAVKLSRGHRGVLLIWNVVDAIDEGGGASAVSRRVCGNLGRSVVKQSALATWVSHKRGWISSGIWNPKLAPFPSLEIRERQLASWLTKHQDWRQEFNPSHWTCCCCVVVVVVDSIDRVAITWEGFEISQARLWACHSCRQSERGELG